MNGKLTNITLNTPYKASPLVNATDKPVGTAHVKNTSTVKVKYDNQIINIAINYFILNFLLLIKIK